MTPYYEDALVTLYHGDCRDFFLNLIADVLVTDPPYGISWRRGMNNARNSKLHNGIVGDQDTSLRDEILTKLPGIPGLVFGSFYAPFPTNLRQVLVWHKPADAGLVGSITGWRRDAEPIFVVGPWPQRLIERSSILHVHAGQAGATVATGHPHTKPVALMSWLLEMCPAGVVLDPFAGSGSTLVAAKNLGRQAVGIEIEERYCEVAARRLSQEVLPLLEAIT